MTDLLTLTTPTGPYVLSVDGWACAVPFLFTLCTLIFVGAARGKA